MGRQSAHRQPPKLFAASTAANTESHAPDLQTSEEVRSFEGGDVLQAPSEDNLHVRQLLEIKQIANDSPRVKKAIQLQAMADGATAKQGKRQAVSQMKPPTSLPPAVQRQVIQLNYDADTELAKALDRRTKALAKIGTRDYPAAIVFFNELKAIAADMLHRHATNGSVDKIYHKHIEGRDATIGIKQHVAAVVAGFDRETKAHLGECVDAYRNLRTATQKDFKEKLTAVLTSVAKNEKSAAVEARKLLPGISSTFESELVKVKKLPAKLTAYQEKVAEDTDLEYVSQKSNKATGGLKEEIRSTLDASKLPALVMQPLTEQDVALTGLQKNIKFYIGQTSKLTVPEAEGEDVSDETKANALKLLAGKNERYQEIAELIPGNFPNQLALIQALQPHHATAAISAVRTYLEVAEIGNLSTALELIKKVGAKGSIADIQLYLQKVKATKTTPTIGDASTFLDDLVFEGLPKLTEFVAEVGKVATMEQLKAIWGAAATAKTVDPTIAFFAGDFVPEKWTDSKVAIGLAYAKGVGKGKPADWTTLLGIKTWSLENILALAAAFGTNDGNATADLWVKTADADATLETKPDEVRAQTRLNMFAGDDWYDKFDLSDLSSSDRSKKKYTQLLYALLGKQDLKGLGDINFENVKGDFLSMLVFFHRHIASFQSDTGQGFDRDGESGGKYLRSSKDHRLNEQYKSRLQDEGVNTSSLLQPLNQSLLGLQGGGGRKITSTGTKGTAKYRLGNLSVSSAGLPSHNLRILGDQQAIIGTSGKKKQALTALLDAPTVTTAPEVSRSLGSTETVTDELVKKQKAAQSGAIGLSDQYENFHDGLLADRGALVSKISTVINTISGGNQVLKAIGSEGHPSIILLVPKPGDYRYGVTDYKTTKAIVPQAVIDFNAATDQEVKATERGSFGFQRPTIADTGDSIRFWPGYAPIESLLPGLKAIVTKLNSKKPSVALTNIDHLDALKSDEDAPVLHVESLKTAMRHAFIALDTKIAGDAPPEKKRVYEWLRTRLLIKLKQAGTLVSNSAGIFGKGSKATQKAKNKHFLVTADMTDKLQEYSMLLAAATLGDRPNPNASHTTAGKFKDTADAYEKNVVSKLGATDYRVFYLDSGEQALVAAGILANRFDKKKDETDSGVEESDYISHNPYFEIGVFHGDKRSNLNKASTGNIVHADLSPVITSGITAPKPQSEIQTGVKRTWQNEHGVVDKAGVIPIIDITNSSMDAVVNLGLMPNNFIIVESLTKHAQLGADKFIMGRLIAVSKTEGTKGSGTLVKTNFLDLAQKVVGPVANEAYNPLLAVVRGNMDRALYGE